MILTITLNPAVDVSYQLDQLAIGHVNRVENTSKTAGGKGLNVSRVAKQLGASVAATGFLGGSLGDFIRSEIKSLHIQDHFIDISGDTRNCIAIIHEGKQTEILESGPTISNEEQETFLQKFEKNVQEAEIVALSGSLPKGMDQAFYSKLLKISNSFTKPVIVDVNGPLIKSTLSTGLVPFLLTPNEEELGQVVGFPVRTDTDVIKALDFEDFAHIPWVIVTQGAGGAMVRGKNKLYKVCVPEITPVNPVGSGDAVVAGFATGYSQGMEEVELIRYALTMGVLNALEEETGSINLEKITEIMAQVTVELVK